MARNNPDYSNVRTNGLIRLLKIGETDGQNLVKINKLHLMSCCTTGKKQSNIYLGNTYNFMIMGLKKQELCAIYYQRDWKLSLQNSPVISS